MIWDIEPTCFAEGTSADYRLSDLNPFYDENKFCQQVIDQSEPAERYKMLSWIYRYNSRFLAYLYKSMFSFGYPEDGYLPIADIKNRYPGMVYDKLTDVLDEQLVEYFVGTIKKCKMGGVNLILSFSPRLTEDDYRDTQSYRQLCRIADQENVPLIDFYHTPLMMGDSTLFKDNAHLNDRGARLFTQNWIEKYAGTEKK